MIFNPVWTSHQNLNAPIAQSSLYGGMNVHIAAKHEKSHLHAQNVKKRLHIKQMLKEMKINVMGRSSPPKKNR